MEPSLSQTLHSLRLHRSLMRGKKATCIAVRRPVLFEIVKCGKPTPMHIPWSRNTHKPAIYNPEYPRSGELCREAVHSAAKYAYTQTVSIEDIVVEIDVDRIIYIIFAVWCGFILVCGIGLFVFLWRTHKRGERMVRLDEKDPLRVFLANVPKIIKILWWTLLLLTIVIVIINSIRKAP
jgi:hypothetical protein